MFNKGCVRSLNKNSSTRYNDLGKYFNFTTYNSNNDAYEEDIRNKELKAEVLLNKEAEEFKKIEIIKKDLAEKKKMEEKKYEPQPMDLDSVPGDIILAKPKEEKKEPELKPIQVQQELGNERVYYTQYIKK